MSLSETSCWREGGLSLQATLLGHGGTGASGLPGREAKDTPFPAWLEPCEDRDPVPALLSCCRQRQGVVTRRAAQQEQPCVAGPLLGAGAQDGHLLAESLGPVGEVRAGLTCYWKPSSSACLPAKLPTAFFGLLFPGSPCIGPGLACLSLHAMGPMFGVT